MSDRFIDFINVDVAIETLPLGTPHKTFSPESTKQRKEVEKELLKLAPDAYSSYDFRDGDGVPLSKIWKKLKPETQDIIRAAYKKEHGERPTESFEGVQEASVLEGIDAALAQLAEALVTERETQTATKKRARLAPKSKQARAFFGKLLGRGDDKNYDDPRASNTEWPIPRTPAWRERRSDYGRPKHFNPTKMQQPRRNKKSDKG